MKKLLLAVFTLVTLQIQAQCWKQVGGGSDHVVALAHDGSIWGWGSNEWFPLGFNGAANMYNSPVQIGTDTHWIRIAAGYRFTLAQKNDGTLWGAGDNVIGDSSMSLVQVNTDTDWSFFSCGSHYVILIKNDGTLWSCGENNNGVLGLGNAIDTGTWFPQQIGTDTDWAHVDAGSSHVLALKTDGTLWGWGSNFANGQSSNIPVKIGTQNDWAKISAGGVCSAAIKTDGTLWRWGSNYFGAMGNGTTTDILSPTQLGNDTWLEIAAGFSIMHGLKTDGTIWGWGDNGMGGVGNGVSGAGEVVLSPVLIDLEPGYKPIALRMSGAAFLNEDSVLKICGDNMYGTVGIGVFGSKVPLPSTVVCPAASLNDNTLSQITLYPNPTSNALTLANAENLNIESITVTDLTGKVVLSQKENNSQINVEVLPHGIYFLNVSAQEGVQHLKFIKE